MKYCPQCGASNPDNAVFCAKCGKSFDAQSQPVQPSGNTIPKMGFSDAVRVCIKEKYACFSGRAKRTEYWFFSLFAFLVIMAAMIVGAFIGAVVGDQDTVSVLMTVFSVVVTLALAVPSIAVTVRRLHDIGFSGLWYFINFVPYVGGIVLFVFTLLASKQEDNEYGPYQVHAE